MLAGGAHSMIHPFGVTGFNLLTALSTRNDAPQKASRPFDLERDGFVLGEGSGMLILEELEHARKRGAKIYAELTGYGSTAGRLPRHGQPRGRPWGHRLHPGGAEGQPPVARRHRLRQRPRHSTHVNDRTEDAGHQACLRRTGLQAAHLVEQEHAGPPHRRGRGGGTHHLHRVDPPRLDSADDQLRDARPGLRSGLRPNAARQHRVRHALSNSFGFGGQNISLIVSEFLG